MADNSGTFLAKSLNNYNYTIDIWESGQPVVLSNGAVVLGTGNYTAPVQFVYRQQYIYKEEEGQFYKFFIGSAKSIAALEQEVADGALLISKEELDKYIPIGWFGAIFSAPSQQNPFGAIKITDGVTSIKGCVTSSAGVWGTSNSCSQPTSIVRPIYIEPTNFENYVRATNVPLNTLTNYDNIFNLKMVVTDAELTESGETTVVNFCQPAGYEIETLKYQVFDDCLDLICELSHNNQVVICQFRKNTGEAYAVYENNTLTFLKDLEGKYSDGEIVDEKIYWTGIETHLYTSTTIPWYDYKLAIQKVIFQDSISPISTQAWFRLFYNLESFENLYNLDTSQTYYMDRMFQSCTKIKILDLSNFTTNMVVSATYMFDGCTRLENIIIGDGWNLSNVSSANSANMFRNCPELFNYDSDYTDKTRAYYGAGDGLGYLSWYREAYAKLDTEGTLTFFTDYSDKYKDAFNITNLRGCTYFFNESVDISVFEEFTRFSIVIINNGQEYDGIEIDLENNYVGYLEQVFHDTTIIYSENQWLNNDYRSITIVGGSDEENPTLIEWLLDNGVFNSDSEGNKYFTGIETTNYYVDTDDISLSVLPSWNNSYRFNNYIIKKVVTQDEIFPLSTAYWFGACRNLIACDLKLLNTQNTTNMEYMFFDCDKLNKIEGLSSFDTSKVTKMSYMFNKDSALKELDLSNFNTSKVEKMGYMFSEMGGFILDISNFDFSKASTCASIFYKSSFDRIIFPQNFKPKANWSRAFGEAKLNQNIIVQSSPSSYGSLFSNLSSGSEVYIIWNGEAGEANIWQRICDTYTNAHYELNDANFAINLTGSNRGYLDDGSWVIDEGGGEIRFQLNTTLTAGKIPFNYTVSLNGSPIFNRREGNTSTVITVTQDATNLQYYYHVIPQDKRKNNWNYYAQVGIIASSDDGPTLSTTMTTKDVIILGEYAAIDILPKAHTIALGKVAERKMSYTAIDNPSGNPKEQGWYEESDGVYSLTKDTTVVSGKTYYTGEENASLQIGLPIYYREHETPIGTVLTGYTTTGSITKSSSTNISHLTDIVTLPPGAWIINVKLRYPSAAAGTRGLSIRYKSLEEGSSEKNIGSSIQYFGVSQSAVHLSTTSFINTTTGATIAIGASQASGSNMTFSEWYWRCMRIL